jgi:hypothetical protein
MLKSEPKYYGACQVCGQPVKYKDAMYCSRACRYTVSKVKVKTNPEPHPCLRCGEPVIRATTKYCAKCNPKAKIIRPCILCGKTIEGRGDKYCSPECYRKDKGAELAKHLVASPKDIAGHAIGEVKQCYVCKRCGKEFVPKAKERTVYCSRECSYADWSAWQGVTEKQERRPKIEPKPIDAFVCNECGETIKGDDATKSYCSRECLLEHNRRLGRMKMAQAKPLIERTCRHCGKKFTSTYGLKRVAYCSVDCCNHHSRAISRRYRRAIERGVGSERIDPLIVYERDGWRCGICGELVDKKLTYPDRASATLDHVLPLAKGGTHTYDNVQIAHAQCNSIKRDRYQEEVAITTQPLYIIATM